MDFDTIFIYSFYMFCVTDTQEEERCKKKNTLFFIPFDCHGNTLLF